MARKRIDKVRVSHLRRLPLERFRKLRVRDFDAEPLMGDVSVVHLELPPRTRLPNIYHARTAELIYCISGSMTARFGERVSSIRAGSVVYIPPGAWHQFSSGSRRCEALAIFRPALKIARHADIHSEPGVNIWD